MKKTKGAPPREAPAEDEASIPRNIAGPDEGEPGELENRRADLERRRAIAEQLANARPSPPTT